MNENEKQIYLLADIAKTLCAINNFFQGLIAAFALYFVFGIDLWICFLVGVALMMIMTFINIFEINFRLGKH